MERFVGERRFVVRIFIRHESDARDRVSVLRHENRRCVGYSVVSAKEFFREIIAVAGKKYLFPRKICQ